MSYTGDHLDWQNAPLVDYEQLFDEGQLARSIGGLRTDPIIAYPDSDGVRYTMQVGNDRGTIDVVRLGEGAVLVFSDVSCDSDLMQRHVSVGNEWLHVQFRLSGSSTEQFTPDCHVTAGEQSCLIVRHPADSTILRTTAAHKNSRVACLFLHPIMFSELFNLPGRCLAPDMRWVCDPGELGNHWVTLSMPANATAALHDLFRCIYNEHSRLTYARAKAAELAAALFHDLVKLNQDDGSLISLSNADRQRLETARQLVAADLAERRTLEDIARAVGMNRTKLAMGFKATFGTSLLAYSRELRLIRARELLERDGMTVSEVSDLIGYAEPSCLTRAFVAKFGFQPKVSRSAGRHRTSKLT